MLAEKYRPTCFDDVVGNKEVVDAIKNSLNTGMGCHAVFITGPYGVGKTTLARIIGMHLRGATNMKELDGDWSYREIDCTRFNSVTNIRERVEKFSYKGFDGQSVVHVFDECAALSKEAQKVLVKSLEDKKLDFNCFIFVTAEPDKLIPDLLDRLTERKLEHVKRIDILRNLERISRLEKKDVDKRALINIAANCGGKIRKSIQLLEDYFSLPDEDKKERLEGAADNDSADRADNDHDSRATFDDHSSPGNDTGQQAENIATSADNELFGSGSEPQSGSGAPIVTNHNHSRSNEYLQAINRTAFTSTAMLNTYFPEPRSFMAPFINEGSLTMIYSVAGAGKSWLSLLIALALTRSKCKLFKLARFRVVEQCGVVFIDGELPCHEIQNRLSILSGPLGEENTQTPLTIVTSETLVEDLQDPIDLDDEAWRNSVYFYMKNNPQNRVLILDNLSSLSGGNSESSREAITPINRWLLSLKRLGLAVILIHHSNKAGGYRGHSSRIDNLDTVISLRRTKKTDELCFEVEFDKARTAKPGDAKNFILESTPHPDNPKWLTWNWYDEDSVELAAMRKDDEIMAYLMVNDVTQREVAKHFKVSQSKVSNCRRKAVDEGYITDEGGVTDAGRQFLKDLGIEPPDSDPEFDLAA